MRALAAVVVLSVVSALPPAFAQTWRTKVTLMEARSPSNCVEADVSKLFYDVSVTGNELSLKTSSGETFSAPVAADGSVKTSFTGSLGANTYAIDLTGNVKTREFEAFNKRFSCRFKLTPVQ
jgi:hypothetical protein